MKVKIIGNPEIAGKRYVQGQEAEFDDEYAELLVTAGSAAKIDGESEEKSEKKAGKTENKAIKAAPENK